MLFPLDCSSQLGKHFEVGPGNTALVTIYPQDRDCIMFAYFGFVHFRAESVLASELRLRPKNSLLDNFLSTLVSMQLLHTSWLDHSRGFRVPAMHSDHAM